MRGIAKVLSDGAYGSRSAQIVNYECSIRVGLGADADELIDKANGGMMSHSDCIQETVCSEVKSKTGQLSDCAVFGEIRKRFKEGVSSNKLESVRGKV